MGGCVFPAYFISSLIKRPVIVGLEETISGFVNKVEIGGASGGWWLCGAVGILSDGLLLPTSPLLTSAAVHGLLLMLSPKRWGVEEEFCSAEKQGHLQTSYIHSCLRNGLSAPVWVARILWPVYISTSDAKTCAVLEQFHCGH